MDWYSVHVEARAPQGSSGLSPEAVDEAADRLADALTVHHGVAGVNGRLWTATLSVQASGPVEAVPSGAQAAWDAASGAGLPPWPLARAEAVREDVLDEDNARIPQNP